MKKLNTFDKDETLNTVGYSKVYLDGKTFLVNFNDRDSVEKFVKFLNNTRDNVYDFFEDKDGNLVVYREDQYEIKLSGRLQYFEKLSKPEQPINCMNVSFMFYKCENITSLDLSAWDTSKITDMHAMFYGCRNLKSLDLSAWDTSNVTYIHFLFYSCINLTSLDLSGWDTTKVIETFRMFSYTPIQDKYRGLPDREIIKQLGGK